MKCGTVRSAVILICGRPKGENGLVTTVVIAHLVLNRLDCSGYLAQLAELTAPCLER